MTTSRPLTPHQPLVRGLAQSAALAGEEDQHEAAGVFTTRHGFVLQGRV
jgi:hypothetical protein